MKTGVRTALLTALVVASNSLGNFCLSWGMKQGGELSSPLLYARALASPWVVLGIGLLILWTLSRMTLLSWADLTFVLPVTSVGYVLSAVLGRFFLQESVSPGRWAGTLLIVAGTAIVGATAPRSEPGGRA